MASPSPMSRDLRYPPPDAVNEAIRHLMERPASEDRAAKYVRLPVLWADATAATDSDWDTAA
ncbi:hypothetical protein OHU45_06835 [Streptomyces tubercidicus]|uniref:hypothetical protein n=2 Tax=Streptomyces tubercidicus TaxID=47759 RepID=UPI002E14012A|nr:hypothetical protein OG761_06630 [Streptomyces tubercidicus]